MDNSIFFKYYDLILEDKAQGFFCINQDHPLPLHPFVDSTTMKVKLECLACKYRIVPGLDLYQRMRRAVEENTKTTENIETTENTNPLGENND